jgi:hypothetical protein
MFFGNEINCTITLAVGDYIETFVDQNRGSTTSNPSSAYTFTYISRFPTSSELVVTPERQNTFAGLKGVASSSATNSVTTNAWTKLTSATTLTRTIFGKAKVETNNDYSITIDNMPVGSYYITATGLFYAAAGSSGVTTECWFGLADTATGGAQIGGITALTTGDATSANQAVANSTIGGIYTVSSIASKTFFLQSYRNSGNGTCQGYSRSDTPLTISVIPLDQPSNSALYVQGPVLGAATGAAIPASYVGEVVTNASDATNTASGTTRNCGTLTLQPGVWDVYATQGTDAVATNPNVTKIIVSISTTTGTLGTGFDRLTIPMPATAASGFGAYTVGPKRVNITSATPYYCVSQITASGNVDYVNSQLKAVRVN